MTIPWMMNCGHSDEGWCLECVSKLGDEAAALREKKNISDDMVDELAERIAENIFGLGRFHADKLRIDVIVGDTFANTMYYSEFVDMAKFSIREVEARYGEIK